VNPAVGGSLVNWTVRATGQPRRLARAHAQQPDRSFADSRFGVATGVAGGQPVAG
jgi:predicted lysophospholipase L1 biosynthesis ABC-type transport system permease subunit